MNRDLTEHRKSYEKGTLDEKSIPDSPFLLFSTWYNEVEKAGGVEEANAMTLATVSAQGVPKSRIVLLKGFDTSGFVFYTNYSSEKGKAIENNNNVCISFFWPNLERQVIITGIAEKIDSKASLDYFRSRPIGSQLGALVSKQSEIIGSRAVLEKRLEALKKEYHKKEIPMPKSWGGYCVKPISFEFWQGGANRLHDRILYSSEKTSWKIERLSP